LFGDLANHCDKNLHPENGYKLKPDDAPMDNVLTRMRDVQINDNPTNTKDRAAIMAKLTAGLKAQNGELKKQELEAKGESDSDFQKEEDRSTESEPFTPATEVFDVVAATNLSAAEILRVKQELAAARSVITRQEQELAETRNLKHTIDQAMGPASEADFGNRADMTEETIQHLQGAFNASARPYGRADAWHPQEDSRSDKSDGLPAGNFNRGRGIWNGPGQPNLGPNLAQALPQQVNTMDTRNAFNAWPPLNNVQPGQGPVPPTQRVFSGPSAPTWGFEGRYGFGDDGSQFNPGVIRRTASQYNSASQYNRATPAYNNRAAPFAGTLGAGLTPLTTTPMNPMNFGGPLGYQPRPIGSPLSPTASEFSTSPLPNFGNAWSPVGLAQHLLRLQASDYHLGQQYHWFNLRHSYRAHELSSSPRQICVVRLEIHCRQDRLQQ
jgi:hypothetical protein